MKKLILTLIITAFIVACKKDSTSTPATPAPAVTPTSAPTQDANLIGVWVQDSVYSEAIRFIDSAISNDYTRDTLYIAQNSYYEVSWHVLGGVVQPNYIAPTVFSWHTLNSDSLITNFMGSNPQVESACNYNVSSNKLSRYNTSPFWHDWYHKIR